MIVHIDWPTKIIHILIENLTPVSPNLYELDVNDLRLALKLLEESEDGMVWPTTHIHNTSIVLAGVTYARTLQIINGYKVQFENSQYTVRCIGGNHNLADVKVQNSVSLIIGNSSGLIQTYSSGTSPFDIATAVRNELSPELNRLDVAISTRASQSSIDTISSILNLLNIQINDILTDISDIKSSILNIQLSLADMLTAILFIKKINSNRSKIDQNLKRMIIYDDDAITPLISFTLKDINANPSIDSIMEKIPV